MVCVMTALSTILWLYHTRIPLPKAGIMALALESRISDEDDGRVCMLNTTWN